MSAVYKREFKSYFISPIGYVCLTVFVFFEALFFLNMYSAGYADITSVFSGMFTITLFLIPILTMRLLSEEKHQKTDQALLTAPVSLWGIALGKFLAAFSIFMLAFSPTLIFQIIFSAVATTDWLVFLGNLVGTALLGASLIALGMFISSLTESQIVAAVGSFAASLTILLLDTLASFSSVNFIIKAASYVSFQLRYNDFTQGTFDISNFLFFLSFTAVFIFLTVRVLEKKRYS